MGKALGCLAILVVVAGIVIFIVFYWTGDLTRAADQLFVLIRDGRAREAYQSTAREFQAATSEEEFLAFLKTSALGEYQSASWSSRSVSGNTGELNGSIQTSGGGVIPIRIKLVKEGGAWKVLAIEKAAAGLQTPAPAEAAGTGLGADAAARVPPADELAALANAAVLQLGRAVNSGDFAAFHQSTSRIWQNQTTAEALKQAFQPLIDQRADLTQIEGKTPEFTETAAIDDSGRLILKGRYSLPSGPLNFTLKFLSEDRQWKLLGIYVSPENPAPAGAADAPAESELADLAGGSIRLLAQAVERDDFRILYDSIARLWQGQTTTEKLREQFKVFVDRKISLKPAEGMAPVFTEKPFMDANRVLVAAGYYPTQPNRLEFRLKFIREGPEWKLVGINVSTEGGK